MDTIRFIAKRVVNLPKSGIRDFFEIVAKMKDVISLGGTFSKPVAANRNLH
jgi:aminotransferase